MKVCEGCGRRKSYTRSRWCAQCRRERERALARVRVRRLRDGRRTGWSPPATGQLADLGPSPESVEPEYIPEPPAPTTGLPPEAPPDQVEPPPDSDPNTLPQGFNGDFDWLERTQLGLAEPWDELLRLSREGPRPDRYDPKVVAALARLKKEWDDYADRFEELTGGHPYSVRQAAIWRAEIERLMRL